MHIGDSLTAEGSSNETLASTFMCENGSIGFPNSIIGSDISSKFGSAIAASDIQIIGSNGPTTLIGFPKQPAATWITAPRIEVHENSAFDDDEGIAESGL